MGDGRIIVFEGIDGAGKSTLCARLEALLESRGRETVVTAEPTSGPVGSLLRSGALKGVSQSTEALLFTADRNDHTEAMRAWADEGRIVLCDRYYASTVAYQSSGLDGTAVDRDWLLSLSSRFSSVPDMTILLDIDPGAAMSRVESRGEGASRFEEARFLSRVREEYLRLAEERGFVRIDASAGPEEVLEAAAKAIEGVLRCIRPRRYARRGAPSSVGRP